MSSAIAPEAAAESRSPAVARSVMVVVAWHVLPACEAVLGNVVVARDSHGDSFGPLILGFHELLLALSLVISLGCFGVLIALGRRRPRLRRVRVLGNLSAVTGIALSAASVVWICVWLSTLASMHR